MLGVECGQHGGPGRSGAEGFRAWLPVAETDDLDRARAILNEWRHKLPDPDSVTGLLEQIDERLASAQ